MKISTRGRYALRVMLDLAVNDGSKPIPLKDIAKRQDITIKYLEQIISMLHKNGFVRSVRGNNGGYMLTGKPEDYSLGDILRVTEGDLIPVECVDNTFFCPRRCNCPTYPIWSGLRDVINEYLDSKTLRDVVDNYNALNSDYII